MSSGLSTTCLSAASILRCPSLTRFQYVILLIPSALEAICTTSLAVMVWKAGQRRHLLLTSEGWAHLILGVIDLLSHVLTPARNDLTVFSAFDVGLGVASFLPLFFYTFYLYIYSNSDLLSSAYSLPKLLARIASLLLLFCIPAIIVANELGSHVGVRRIMFNNQILIGFPSRGLFSLNAFFTSLTLALLILFQAIVFLIAFFRLIVAVLNQRKFQNKGRDAYHLVKGVAWLSAGLKLGAIETLVGFMGGSFEAVLARKIVHCISRVLLCVGIIKGVDYIEDFNVVRKEMQEASRSKLTLSPFNIETASPPKATGIRGKISGPRMSTFQQLSPTAKEFYQLPRAHLYQDSAFDWNKDTKSPNSAGEYSSERGLGGIHVSQVDTSGKEVVPRLRSLQELKGIEAFSNLKEQVRAQREASAETSLGEEYEYDDEKADRVTIGRRDSNGAPTLLLKRFSSAMFPSPTDVIATIRKSLFRNSARASPTESESEKGGVRESQYPATVLADYEKEYGDSYTIPTLAKDSRRVSKASSFGEKEDPVSFLRPNVSQIPAKPSPFPVQSVRGPGPYHYIRNSVIRGSQGSYASRLSDLEIVTAPRRTLSGKRADATFYSVANTQFDSSTRRSSFAGDSGIAPPPQAMFANQLAESPEDYGPLSSAPQQPVSAPASAQFRIVSDYSQFRDSTATSDYRGSTTSQILQPQEVRNLTRQFPGPPLTFNGRPVMGGLGQRNIYDDETSSSGPETPVTAIAITRPVRRQSGLRNEVLVGVKGKNRLSVQSDMSEQSGLTIASGFVGVVPPLPSAGPRSAPAARRSSIGPVYALPYDQDPKRVSDSSSQYSFDVDLESGNRASYMRDEVPSIAVVGDVEEGQHSPATDGHGGFTPKGGNALGLLRPKLSTNTLGGSVRPQPSMSSVASAASQDPFRDNQESPASTTFAADPHTPTGQMPSSATGSTFASSRSVRTIGTLTAPSHNVSAPVSPADDDMGRGNSFTISPMSLIDDLPTAAIVDSVNDPQYGRSRRPADGWPAFASPDSARTEFTVNAQPFQMPSPRGPPFPVPSVPTSRSASRGRRDDDEDDEDERKRRQRSMDAAARDVSTSIPWLTAPSRREVKERTPQRAIPSNVPVSPLNPQRPTSKIPVASGSRKRNSKGGFRESPKKQLVPLPVTRIKTIGNVKQRTTPRPVQDHPGMTRGSVYIQPIMIPRQSATLGGVFAVNEEGEPETLVTESPVDMRSVRRDSDVFGTTLGGEMRK